MNAVAQGQAIEELLARSAFYHGLSVVLRYPGTETVKWLASQEHRRLIDVAEMLRKENGEPLPEAVRRLVTALDTVSIPEWAQQHERVFGHSVQSAAPPYELEYGEEHSHRQPQELGDIAAFYQAFGLRASLASHERVDHIVTECEFMQYLLYKQACALDKGSQERADVCEAAARQFLADHLGCWGPAFCLRLSRAAEQACLPKPRLDAQARRRQGILGAVAEAALAWLVQDCTRVGVPAGSRDLPLRLPKERDDVGCAPACRVAIETPERGAGRACALPSGSADDKC